MAKAPSYTDLATKRQAMLERLKSGQVRDFAAYIKKIEKLVRQTLLALDDEVSGYSFTKLNKLLSDLRADQAAIFKTATTAFLAEAADISALYMAYEVGDLEKTVDLRGTKLNDFTKKDLFSKVIKRPMTTDGQLLEPWIKDFTDKEVARVNNAIRAGWSQGKTNQELVQQIAGTKAKRYKDGVLEVTRRNASTVVRTSVQHAASAARQETWEANRDVVAKYEWLSTLDRVTSRQCRTLDGEVFEFGEGPVPPIHPNCLLPGTLITATCGITHVFKRAYKGKAFRIKTRSGNVLTVTPNHPILTKRGWAGAQFLNVGDKCFVNSLAKGVVSPKGENNTVYATVEQITEAFGGAFEVPPCEVPTTAPNFHGDGTNNEVTKVWAKRDLLPVFYTPKVKHRGKRGFIMRDCNAAVFRFGFGAFSQFFYRGGSPLGRFMCVFGKVRDLFRGRKIHSGLLLFGTVPQFDVAFSQNSLNGSWADAEFLRKSTDTNSSFIFTDDVVDIQVFNFTGHVYNLQTENHIIESNGIVTHNCRSTTIPVLDKKFSFLSEGRTRSGETGPVSADKSYYDWLKNQPKETQLEVLGPTRTKLFRDGGMSAERFRELQFDRNFEPLTLDEMRELEPEAFKRAGI